MPSPFEILAALGAETVHALWLPLLLWTMVCLPVVAILRAWKSAHPEVQYGANHALLLALPFGLLLAYSIDLSFLQPSPMPAEAGTPQPLEILLSPLSSTEASPWNLYVLLGSLTLLAALLAIWRLARLGRQAYLLHRSRRVLEPAPGEVQRRSDALARRLGVHRHVEVRIGLCTGVPLTFGWRRPVVVLPPGILQDQARLSMILTHELVHVRRHDYLFHWTEQTLGAVFFIHPLVAILREAIDGHRELACDIEVLHHSECTPRDYAALLCSFLLPARKSILTTLGMAETSNLKQRIYAMKTKRHRRFPQRTLLVVAVAALFIATGTFVAACSDALDVREEVGAGASLRATTHQDPLSDADKMPELVGGLASIYTDMKYPVVAKNAGIQGRVVVQFVVDKDGRVVDPLVVEGIGAGCDAEAVRALSVATFKPGLKDGEPVPVQMTIPFMFKLAADEDDKS